MSGAPVLVGVVETLLFFSRVFPTDVDEFKWEK